MASIRGQAALLSRLSASASTKWRPAAVLCSASKTQARHASSQDGRPRMNQSSQNAAKYKKKGEASAKKKKRKNSNMYREHDRKDLQTFSLLDAIRYLRAFEVGRAPTSVKYDIAVKLKSIKNGPVVRNRLRLPHPVKTNLRICVICPADSKYATDALAAGATMVGEDDIFEAVKDRRIEFDRCICQLESLPKLTKSGVARVLGPRGLMPSLKLGTVVKDPATIIKDLVGGAEYRERLGIVRMAVGQLGFTPEETSRNIKALMDAIKKDIGRLGDTITKEISEVVLSTTNGPGFSLNGNFKDNNSPVSSKDLSSL